MHLNDTHQIWTLERGPPKKILSASYSLLMKPIGRTLSGSRN